jgi:hypothetical protein
VFGARCTFCVNSGLELAHHNLEDVEHERQEAYPWTDLKKGSILSSGTTSSMMFSADAHVRWQKVHADQQAARASPSSGRRLDLASGHDKDGRTLAS